MKRSIFILLLIALTTVSLSAQTAPDEKALVSLLNEFLAGAGKNDAAVHDRFWADDLIYTRSAGVRITKAELMDGVRKAPAAKPGDPVTVYNAENIRVQQYGNTAVVAFKLVAVTTKSDGSRSSANFLDTGTFVKRGGKWQAVAWQATAIPAPAETKLDDSKPVITTAMPVEKRPSPDGRTYLKGSRGGCYYLTDSGKKSYVDHKYCDQQLQ